MFILEQALNVAEKYFIHEEDVLLLTIDPSLVKAEIKYELASNGQEYPHVYGAINIDAIIDVVPFPKEKGNLYYQSKHFERKKIMIRDGKRCNIHFRYL